MSSVGRGSSEYRAGDARDALMKAIAGSAGLVRPG
jgi:hypothetical protein